MNPPTNPDITEIKVLLSDLQSLEAKLPGAIQRWKQDIGTCNSVAAFMRDESQALRNLCDRPGNLNQNIFAPIYSFLNAYIANREGRIAFTAQSLDAYLLRGLRAIYNYSVVADFFARNPQYIFPTPPVSAGLEALTKAQMSLNKEKGEILSTIERLIGCKNDLNFLFLRLLSTVKNLNQDMQTLKSRLEDECRSVRIEKLKM